MSKKHREASRLKQRLQDRYIDGLTDDEQAEEAMEWHEEFAPPYEASSTAQHHDEALPF